mgnify:FL=1
MQVRLKRDIVIPAGTILDDAPRRLEMCRGHVEHILGLTKDTSGSLLYFVDPDDAALADWFEVLDATVNAHPCGDLGHGWIRRQQYGEA